MPIVACADVAITGTFAFLVVDDLDLDLDMELDPGRSYGFPRSGLVPVGASRNACAPDSEGNPLKKDLPYAATHNIHRSHQRRNEEVDRSSAVSVPFKPLGLYIRFFPTTNQSQPHTKSKGNTYSVR